jgi:hypothetical protein
MKGVVLVFAFMVLGGVGCHTPRASTAAAAPLPLLGFIPLPSAGGFGSVNEMLTFATSSAEGGGSVEELTVADTKVWVIVRSVTSGGPTAEVTFCKCVNDLYRPFLIVPMALSELRVQQRGIGIALERYDPEKHSFQNVFLLSAIP